MLTRVTHCAIAGLGIISAAFAREPVNLDYDVRVLVPPSAMHAVEGIALDEVGRLYATSIHAQRVYRIDTRSGAVSVVVPSPAGEADDVAIGPLGTRASGVIAWTAQRSGEVRARQRDGSIAVLLRNAPRVNPIAFNASGRLFAAQSGAGDDTLWELDPLGIESPRRVLTGTRLNGFGFGADGLLYAPHFGTDKLVAIDVDAGTLRTVASGLGAPAAVRVGRDGALYSVDYLRGDLWRTDTANGQSVKLTTVREPLDSLALLPDGRIFLSAAADSSILEFDPATSTTRTLTQGWFTLPTGMTLTRCDHRACLLVADTFGYRYVDTQTGAVTRTPWAGNRGASTAIAADTARIAIAYAPAGRVRVVDRVSELIIAETSAIKTPRGIALLEDGALIVADATGGRLLELHGAAQRELAVGLEHPVAVLAAGANSLWVSEFASGQVIQFERGSGRQRLLADGLVQPTGLARLSRDRLLVVEASQRRISALDLKTKTRTVIASGLPLALDGLDLPVDTPAGVVVDRDGVIYVSCPGDNSIRVLQPKPGRREGERRK